MSEYKYLDKDGLIYYHSKIKTLLGGKVDKVDGKGLSTNDFTTTLKNKLDGIASGAEVNQNAFSNVIVGQTTIAADSKTDNLTLEAGSNVTLTPNATSDKITIAATDTTYEAATTSAAGLMSAADKTKLNGVATGAEVNQNAFSNVKVGTTTVQADAKTDTLELVAGSNVTLTPDATNDKITIAATDTTYDAATTSAAGLMSAADKTKLNGIAEGATANTGTVTSIATSGAITGGTITSSGTISHSTSAGYKHIPTNGASGNYLKYGGSSGTASWAAPDSSVSSSSTNTTIPGSKAVYDAIQDAISGITGIQFEIVQTLPQTGRTGTIYLVSNSGSAPNIYDEYIWIASTSKFEKIGTTDVDLSGYVQASEMVSITNAEIDTIVA